MRALEEGLADWVGTCAAILLYFLEQFTGDAANSPDVDRVAVFFFEEYYFGGAIPPRCDVTGDLSRQSSSFLFSFC